MNETERLRNWLLKHPRPAMVRVTADGDTTEIEVEKNQSWRGLAETIMAKAPEVVELLGPNGKLIRAQRPQEETRRNNAPMVVPEQLHTDPETARLTHVANLLHRAYEHSTDVAFSKLVELVDRWVDLYESTNRRLERVEQQYRRELNDRLEEAYERLQDEGNLPEDPQEAQAAIMQAFFGSMSAGRAQRRAAGAAPTNGAKEE